MDDSHIIPFLKNSKTDRRPNTPNITLSLEFLSSSGTLNKNRAPGILITLYRTPNDIPNKPCIFYWSSSKDGFGPDGFILLYYTTEGYLKQVEVQKPQRFEIPNFSEIRAYDHSIHQPSPGGCDRWFHKIPERYRDVLFGGCRYSSWGGSVGNACSSIIATVDGGSCD
ncbi:uncharacterized protein ASPGLDRAFT_1517014 [Aspergillus glaucus CBS 516.65]|uniref:Uncharacterized protein n=1 Tax=Aspergillus glaucus CBS 516.65 TaxID=1160497 RepID=A0A1L9VLN8_ASPGL|nr:hypothetical protein ASPGLDRAFT_1517014 [Aspergillus glaucus CBS 516.65]OJJ84790.1 hypothetical protein ASPGLDRAFT_1517014 [Aspergillus glaucus CBS 516.65]